MSRTVPPEVAHAWAERTCAEQGLSVKVTDPPAVRDVAVLFGQRRQSGSTRSG